MKLKNWVNGKFIWQWKLTLLKDNVNKQLIHSESGNTEIMIVNKTWN